eukprot:TRINITY_DN18032_c0_g1_i1.p1 TRINITY_DN18032_c0_g1~~TRINITY_DN18032_c0_g1_i1.p1  ORF type:complete len:459 (+),score=109.84 TRINITY_DN18032_c0_g1_i1:101-1477(+)
MGPAPAVRRQGAARTLALLFTAHAASAAEANDPSCTKNPCRPWRNDEKNGTGEGGGSCAAGDQMDLRFAYGEFGLECSDPETDPCCGTNAYGNTCSSPSGGPSAPCTKRVPADTACGASSACACFKMLYWTTLPTKDTAVETGYLFGDFSSGIEVTATAAATVGSKTYQEVTLATGAKCAVGDACLNNDKSPQTSACPAKAWVYVSALKQSPACTSSRRAETLANDSAVCSVAASPPAGVSKCFGYKTHIYCPKVDNFQQFKLTDSAKILQSLPNTGRQITVMAYGHGNSSADLLPDAVRFPAYPMNSRAVIYEASHEGCPDYGPAIASFLLYNVTLRTGSFGYKNKQPIGTGFISTCDGPGKQCIFDSKSVCIGKNGTQQYNCAKCLKEEMKKDGVKIADLDVNIMVTYYGTDKDKKTLTSGSSNPLNFREFADADVYEDVYDKARNFKPPSLPFGL